MVAAAGFAPAWACAQRFLKTPCILIPTTPRNWCRRGDSHSQGSLVLDQVSLLIPDKPRRQNGAERGNCTRRHLLTKQGPRYLGVISKKLVRLDGLAPSEATGAGTVTACCNCCSATGG